MLEIVFCSLGPNAYITRANAPNAKNEESLVQGEAQLYGQKKNNHFPVFLVASRWKPLLYISFERQKLLS